MPGAAQHALLHHPRIRPDLQHVEIVIRFQHQAIRVAQVHLHQLRHVAEIRDQRHLYASRAKREADGIGRIVRDGEGMHLNIADPEALAGVNRFDAAQALASRSGSARCSASIVCSVTYSGAFHMPSICGRPLQ